MKNVQISSYYINYANKKLIGSHIASATSTTNLTLVKSIVNRERMLFFRINNWFDPSNGMWTACNDFSIVNSEVFYFCPDSGKVYKTTNGGDTWTATTRASRPIDEYPWLINIDFINDTIGYTMSYNTLFRTTNGGNNWTYQFNVPPGQEVYAVPTYMRFANSYVGYITLGIYGSGG